jgi:Zinc-ribbon containing domain
VNENSLNNFQLALASMSRWLTPLLIIILLGSVGLGWLVKSFFILLGFLLLAPVIAFLGFRWWLKRNLVQDQCPVCHHEFVGLNQTQFQCPSCNEPLTIEQGHFQRLTPPGTIDVQAVEFSAQRLND